MQTGIMYVADEVIDKFKRIEGVDNPQNKLLDMMTAEIQNEILEKLKNFLKIEAEEVVRQEYERQYYNFKEEKLLKTKDDDSLDNPFMEET